MKIDDKFISKIYDNKIQLKNKSDKITLSKASHHTLKKFVADRPGYDKTYLIDYTKSRTELGWNPLIPVKEGLITTVNEYIKKYTNNKLK